METINPNLNLPEKISYPSTPKVYLNGKFHKIRNPGKSVSRISSSGYC